MPEPEDEINRRVKDYLQLRFLTVLVERTIDRTDAYLYSGSVVEVGDNWVWITAAHNVDHINEWLESPETRAALAPLAGPGRVDLARGELRMVNMQDRLRSYRDRWPEVVLTDEEIDLYDIGFAVIPTLRKLYLINYGVKPFKFGQCLPNIKDILELARSAVNKGIFVAGVPDSSHELKLGHEMSLAFEFFTYPLHPDPDTTPDLDDRRQVCFEGQYTWLPTAWSNLTGDITGVSGGPTVIYLDGEYFFIGVATKQKPRAPRTPRYVGVTDGSVTFQLLRDLLGDETQDVGTEMSGE